jgi:putative transposase
MVYHVLNRGVGRMRLFHSDADYAAWERAILETLPLAPMRICAYCWMPNHWHLVLRPERDGQLSTFLQRATNRHTQRWQHAKRRVGYGHLYQGRFKSFPVESDDHFYSLVRYVERNALRAGLVARAEDWRWSSLCRRPASEARLPLSTWPVPRPSRWTARVNQPQTAGELAAIRHSIRRGRPYGGEAWTTRIAHKFGLESTLRPRGRPRKQTAKPR